VVSDRGREACVVGRPVAAAAHVTRERVELAVDSRIPRARRPARAPEQRREDQVVACLVELGAEEGARANQGLRRHARAAAPERPDHERRIVDRGGRRIH